MQEVVDKNRCVGCSACKNSCPKGAISMIEGYDGFLYPKIDQSKCVDCGLCRKNCPIINTSKNESINKCYVGYAKDEDIRYKSSSGGIFTLIANCILDNDGIVIGAAFDDKNKLNHIAISSNDELEKIRGSKYLQSNLNNIFTFIENNLETKKILFVGTPCQVAGLKSFIKNDFNNLLCIDIICHGVPSHKLFEKYIKEIEEKYSDKLINYNFRDKSTGWNSYSNTAIFENKKISELQKDNSYMKLFLSDVALRESCYNCKFKLGNKYSDITLGDFWGVNNYYPEMYNKNGVSAIIINTQRGEDLFKDINNELTSKPCKLEEIVSGNPSLICSGKCPSKRNVFLRDLDGLSIKQLEKKYVKKVSIIRRILIKLKSKLVKKK